LGGANAQPGAATPLWAAPEPATQPPGTRFHTWQQQLKQMAGEAVAEFVSAKCTAELADTGVDIASDVLSQFISGGKCLRSTFMYLGWLCGADDDEAALRASASLELLHAFALLHDDVMDEAELRRGAPSAHLRFAGWHRDRALPGSAGRFGESAAILLGDLCLVWAEQMLRESGVPSAALQRAWPRYNAMRTELAIGQFADLCNVAPPLPAVDVVLDIARRKSGNYTVRRPLEIGAAMSGCDERSLWLLGRYGSAVGEAFQLRDDLLGAFGSPAITGKPSGTDFYEHKVTSVVAAANQLADPSTRRQLLELMTNDDVDENDLVRWRALITATGASDWIENMISERVSAARELIYRLRIDESVQTALVSMATVSTERAA
jgi:geranylgeranyl diphosphate synthase, type I